MPRRPVCLANFNPYTNKQILEFSNYCQGIGLKSSYIMAHDIVPLANGILKFLTLAASLIFSLFSAMDVFGATHSGLLGRFSGMILLMCCLAAWWAFWSLIDWMIQAAGGQTFNDWFKANFAN